MFVSQKRTICPGVRAAQVRPDRCPVRVRRKSAPVVRHVAKPPTPVSCTSHHAI